MNMTRIVSLLVFLAGLITAPAVAQPIGAGPAGSGPIGPGPIAPGMVGIGPVGPGGPVGPVGPVVASGEPPLLCPRLPPDQPHQRPASPSA